MKSKPALIVICSVILGLLVPADALAEFSFPPGSDFVDELVVGGVPNPTAIAWLPPSENNHLLIASQGGQLFRFDGTGPADEVLNLSSTICSGGEMGLLGLAVDPAFESGARFVYLYYTDDKRDDDVCNAATRANRVSRFSVDVSDAFVDELVLIDNIPAPGSNHNGGDLQFDNGGLLYVAVGDGGVDLHNPQAGQGDNANARRLDLLNGKILRIQTDGSIPPGNPFTGEGTVRCNVAGQAPSDVSTAKKKKKKKRGGKGKKSKKHKKKQRKKRARQRRMQNRNQGPICQEIYATGLRNPFRIAFDPADDDNDDGHFRFNINDVGGGAWEEISRGAPRADYGWNVREGPCPTGEPNLNNCSPDARFTEPIFAYRHQTGCRTITGGAFVPEDADWPGAYDGVYLYADFICDTLFALRNETPPNLPESLGTGSAVTQLKFGPDNELYYTAFNEGGQVRRIVYNAP